MSENSAESMRQNLRGLFPGETSDGDVVEKLRKASDFRKSVFNLFGANEQNNDEDSVLQKIRELLGGSGGGNAPFVPQLHIGDQNASHKVNLDLPPEANFDLQFTGLQKDLKKHIESLSDFIKTLQFRIESMQIELEKKKQDDEKSRSNSAGQIIHLETVTKALEDENKRLNERIAAIKSNDDNEKVDTLTKQLDDMSKMFAEMTKETAALREKLMRSKDTLFADKVRKHFNINNDEDFEQILEADDTLTNSIMILLKPNASREQCTEWRKKIVTSIKHLSGNNDLMKDIRQMFSFASQEKLPEIAQQMKNDEEPSVKLSGNLLEKVLTKDPKGGDIEGLMAMVLVLFTTFVLKPNFNQEEEDIEEEEDS